MSDGRFQPALKLYTTLGTEPTVVTLQVQYCFVCAEERKVEDILDEDTWLHIKTYIEEQGLLGPDKRKTQLGWVPIAA